MNKGLLGLIIAAIVAIIGFLVYKFFFKTSASVPVSPLGGQTTGSNNPISTQDVGKVEAPVVLSPSGDTATFGGIYQNGFDLTQKETITHGTALSELSNNPGALFWDNSTQWQGMNVVLTCKNGIIYFEDSDHGVRAHLMTLKNYYKKHGIDTLAKITARYAPVGSGGNNPVEYARILGSYLGIGVNDTFNMDSNRELLAAIGYFMHRVEAGYFWLPRTKYSEWSTKV
jgi:hypothetical protein